MSYPFSDPTLQDLHKLTVKRVISVLNDALQLVDDDRQRVWLMTDVIVGLLACTVKEIERSFKDEYKREFRTDERVKTVLSIVDAVLRSQKIEATFTTRKPPEKRSAK